MTRNNLILLSLSILAVLFVVYLLLGLSFTQTNNIKVDQSAVNSIPTTSDPAQDESDSIERLDSELDNLQLPEDVDFSDDGLGL